ANRELARRLDELNAEFEKKTGEDNIRFNAIFQELRRLALAIHRNGMGFRRHKKRIFPYPG
ncbi:MAG: hypothetical protein LBU64_00640, partial [Planctomycetota bacterium]|nr:hypothetical protein [Planctomycetota bacterium]